MSRFGPQAREAISAGDFFADGARRLTFDEPYLPGMRVWVFRPVPDEPETPIELPVVFENDRILVVDKPAGMATIPRGSYVARSVTVAARRQFGNDNLVTAHRLDADTAGLVLLTKEHHWRGAYQLLFERRQVTKRYRAIAPLVDLTAFPPTPSGENSVRNDDGVFHRIALRIVRPTGIQASVVAGEPNAITDARLVATLPTPPELTEVSTPLVLYDLAPLTGKIHQLRVTLNHLGAPIVGDRIYPRLFGVDEPAGPYPLQLHARELAFTDPIDGKYREFFSTRRLDLT